MVYNIYLGMKERSPQDQAWIEQKNLNEAHNRLLADKVIWRGQFWRRTISAGRAYRAMLKLSSRIHTKSNI